MAFKSPLSIITTRSAAHRCGNPCRWSKWARPLTHPTNHTSHNTFHINQLIFTLGPTTHQHILIIPLLALTMNVHVTEIIATSRNRTFIHQLTSSLDVLNLAVEGHWMYWYNTGIHVDVDGDFPTFSLFIFHFSFSFSLFQAIKPPVVLLLGCGVLVRLTSHCDSFIWSVEAYCPESFVAKADI